MRVVACCLLMLFAVGAVPLATTEAQEKTAWGWPLPYEKVSDKSVDWLKKKGWWPLRIGIQAYYPSFPLWRILKLDEARGLQVDTAYFVYGAQQNEAAVAGRLQGNVYGSFPFISFLVQGKLPVRVIGIGVPNSRHALLVPLNSPVKAIGDLKKLDHQAVIGLVVGSTSEFYLQSALQVHGMKVGQDVILKNLTPADLLLMPKGLDGVVQWDPFVTLMADSRKNARVVDSVEPYNFSHGVFWIQQEIIDNAPDVVQALADMFVEGVLFTRHDPNRARELFRQQEAFRFFGELELNVLIDWATKYKPTMTYVFPNFWSVEDARITRWLFETGRILKELTADELKAVFETRFLDNTYKKLGWRVPERPPWIPKDWKGVVGKPPYPKYHTPVEAAQPWPEKDDLIK